MVSGIFEWDDEKAEVNLRKHGVSFPEGATVFEDPFLQIEADALHSVDEPRAFATGFSAASRVLLVVYTERRERIRLISARKATLVERRKYESQFE
ncbi:MAG: BrnT family toxin [Terracidiphilus sp.]